MSIVDQIKEDVQAARDKLDQLKQGKDVETAFLIDRSDYTLHLFLRDDLGLIVDSMK